MPVNALTALSAVRSTGSSLPSIITFAPWFKKPSGANNVDIRNAVLPVSTRAKTAEKVEGPIPAQISLSPLRFHLYLDTSLVECSKDATSCFISCIVSLGIKFCSYLPNNSLTLLRSFTLLSIILIPRSANCLPK